MRTAIVQDVFCAAVPEAINPAVVDRAWLELELMSVVRASVWAQWAHSMPWQQPLDVQITAADWLFTQTPDDVERFQPAHDCAACQAGNDQARAYLREHPDRWVVLANVTYTEEWP